MISFTCIKFISVPVQWRQNQSYTNFTQSFFHVKWIYYFWQVHYTTINNAFHIYIRLLRMYIYYGYKTFKPKFAKEAWGYHEHFYLCMYVHGATQKFWVFEYSAWTDNSTDFSRLCARRRCYYNTKSRLERCVSFCDFRNNRHQ